MSHSPSTVHIDSFSGIVKMYCMVFLELPGLPYSISPFIV